MSMRILKIEDAETGRVISLRVDIDEMNLNRLKEKLAIFVPVQPQDQILLCGPPYKLLETQFGPQFIQTEDQRIFLYNRLIFSTLEDDTKRIVPTVRLNPIEFPIPEVVGELPREIAQLQASEESPIFGAILKFERKFLKNLKLCEAYMKGNEDSYRSSMKCFDEQLIQNDALSAALNHFKEDFNNISVSFHQTKQKIIDQQVAHGKILSTFDQELENLSNITLSPYLQRVRRDRSLSNDSTARTERVPSNEIQLTTPTKSDDTSLQYLNESSSKLKESYMLKQTSTSSIERNTLLDCVPVEKERRWAMQCREVHTKVENNMVELDTLYDNINILVNTLEDPTIDFEKLKRINEQLNASYQQQQHHMEDIRSNYHYVYDTLTQQNILTNKPEQHVAILSNLETIRVQQETVISSMLQRCEQAIVLKDQMGKSKEEMTKCLFNRITLIALIQTDVQKLMERLLQMKKWYKGRNEYFSHLEHVAHLPEAYEAFLREIIRRKRYHSMLESKIVAFTDGLSKLRDEETSFRKEFMQHHGKNLPPIFFEMIPSLMEKPPYYKAQASDIPILPPVSEEEIINLHAQLPSSNHAPDSVEEKLMQIYTGSRAMAHDHGDASVIFQPTLPEPPALDNQLSLTQYQDIMNENAALKDRIAELTQVLEDSKSHTNIIPTKLIDSSTLVNDDGERYNIDPAASTNPKLQEDVMDETSYRQLSLVLSEGLMNVESALVGDILQRLADIADSTESVSLDDSIILGDSGIRDVQKAKSLIDRILSLVNQFKSTVSKKFSKDVQNLSFKIQALEDELENKNRLGDVRSMDMSSTLKSSTTRSFDTDEIFISVSNFVENTIALFIYRNPTTYIAFHVNCPHRYLSEESLNIVKQSRGKFPRDFIIGRVIFYDRKIASTEENPFELSLGTEYYLLTVEDLTSQRSQTPKSSKSRKDSMLNV